MIPLVRRTQQGFSAWLAPHYGDLRLEADLDRVDALAGEREAEWRRIGAASFLSEDEKREALGWRGGNKKDNAGCRCKRRLTKYRPDQARDNRSRWIDEGAQNEAEGTDFGSSTVSIDCDSLYHYDLQICNSGYIRQDSWLRGQCSAAARIRLSQCEAGIELSPLLPE